MRALIAALLLTFIAGACAVVEPPSGGPEDKLPPEISTVVPAPDSAGVSRDSRFEMKFSEKIDGDSFKKLISIYPPVDFEKIETKGSDLSIRFRGELPETTFCVILRPGFKDYHGVSSKRGYTYYFSTAPEIDRGSISGKILFKQRPDTSGVVKLLSVGPDTISDVIKAQEARTAYTDALGNYLFRALPEDSTRFILWSFTDRDKDGRYSEGKDLYTVYPDTVLLTSDRGRLADIDMSIIDPDEPASIAGRIINRTGMAGRVMIRFDRTDEDVKPYVMLADTSGSFALKRVHAGYYLWSAFMDVSADSIMAEYTDPQDSSATLPEPGWRSPDTLYVKPGEDKVLEPVTITGGGDK